MQNAVLVTLSWDSHSWLSFDARFRSSIENQDRTDNSARDRTVNSHPTGLAGSSVPFFMSLSAVRSVSTFSVSETPAGGLARISRHTPRYVPSDICKGFPSPAAALLEKTLATCTSTVPPTSCSRVPHLICQTVESTLLLTCRLHAANAEIQIVESSSPRPSGLFPFSGFRELGRAFCLSPSISFTFVFKSLQIPLPATPMFSHLYEALGGAGISVRSFASHRSPVTGHESQVTYFHLLATSSSFLLSFSDPVPFVFKSLRPLFANTRV
jgi:hypothetical protein